MFLSSLNCLKRRSFKIRDNLNPATRAPASDKKNYSNELARGNTQIKTINDEIRWSSKDLRKKISNKNHLDLC